MARALSSVISGLSVLLAVFAVYVAGYGSFTPSIFRGGVVLVSMFLCALLLIQTALRDARRLDATVVVAVASVAIAACMVFTSVQIKMDTVFYFPDDTEVWIGFAGVLAIIEMTRRLWGWSLAAVGAAFFGYAFAGPYLPGLLEHTGFTVPQVVDAVWFNYSGVFGLPVSIIAGLVWVFIIFGVVLKGTGASDSLLKIAMVVTARTRGGPAHAAIVASSLFGTMSGAAIANVVGTGTFTIPMIKKRGFPPAFAGGIEATASSGGQIVPPIMGAAAFLMAEITGIPYGQVAIAALLPAAFYYISLFASVSIEARRQNIQVIDRGDIPELTRDDAIASITFLGPILAIVLALVWGYSAAYAGFVGLITALVLSVLNPEIRRSPWSIVSALAEGGQAAAKLMVAVALIGMIIGVVNMTGVGLRFANLIESMGEGSLYLSLLLTMCGAIILGMGMPTLPAYLIIIVIMGPAFVRMGVETLVIHMFVLYYAVASSITPPVALAAYAAASIANANPITTSLMAIRLGAAKYLLPFVFVTYPSMLLVVSFDWAELLWLLPRLLLMVWLVSTALSNYDFTRLGAVQIGLRLAAAFLVMVPDWELQGAGFIISALLLFANLRSARRETNLA
jgi:TRAP transporter 4TM/12TM fusion protein